MAPGISQAPASTTQENPSEQQAENLTHSTSFPITNNDSWLFFSTGDTNKSHLFFYYNNIDFKNRTIRLWIRNYNYIENELSVGRWTINRDSNNLQVDGINSYSLNSGNMYSNKNPSYKSDWIPIAPQTIPDNLINIINYIEKNDPDFIINKIKNMQ